MSTRNYEKFRRYDTFPCWWWQHTSFADGDRPYVMFICQDQDQRDRFLNAPDRELTSQLWHPSPAPEEVYIGRQRVIFACELDVHLGRLGARRVPGVPPGDARRHRGGADIRGVRRSPGAGGRCRRSRDASVMGLRNSARMWAELLLVVPHGSEPGHG